MKLKQNCCIKPYFLPLEISVLKRRSKLEFAKKGVNHILRISALFCKSLPR